MTRHGPVRRLAQRLHALPVIVGERPVREGASSSASPSSAGLAPPRRRIECCGAVVEVETRGGEDGRVPRLVAHLQPDDDDRARTILAAAVPWWQDVWAEQPITLVWVGRRGIVGIEPGVRLRVRGLLTVRKAQPTVFNPAYDLLPERPPS